MVLQIPHTEVSHRSQAVEFYLIIWDYKNMHFLSSKVLYIYSNLTRTKSRNKEKQIKSILLQTQSYNQKRESLKFIFIAKFNFISFRRWGEELRQSSVYMPFYLLLTLQKVLPSTQV